MSRLLRVILLPGLLAVPLWGVQAAQLDCGGKACPPVRTDQSDKFSLQRGARLYMNYCLGCHSLQYMRYEHIATDLEIPVQLMKENLILDDSRLGNFATNTMSAANAAAWFGTAPPDLTLVVRRLGAAWLYAYLRSFYADPDRPWGVNNAAFPNVAMPHVLQELQGLQGCVPSPAPAAGAAGAPGAPDPCATFELLEPGALSPPEFDAAMGDLVNFLEYMADPSALKRQRIGVFVLLFLAVFLVFAVLLDREYWKDVR